MAIMSVITSLWPPAFKPKKLTFLVEMLLGVGLEVPPVDGAVLLAAVEDFGDAVPGDAVDLLEEIVLDVLLLVVGLRLQGEAGGA